MIRSAAWEKPTSVLGSTPSITTGSAEDAELASPLVERRTVVAKGAKGPSNTAKAASAAPA